MTAEQLDEVRRIVRLEALRSAVLSHASESLDEQIPRMAVFVELHGETLGAIIQYVDAAGEVVSGGTL